MVRTRNYVVAFIAGAVLIVAAAWAAIVVNHRRTVAEWGTWLSETAENRAFLVGRWLAERVADAEVTALRADVRDAFTARGRALSQADVDSITVRYGYDALVAVDRAGRVVLSGASRPPLTARARALVAAVLATETTQARLLGDPGDSAVLGIAAPVHAERGHVHAGAILIFASAYRQLLPLALHQTGRLREAETLLASVTGDTAVLIARGTLAQAAAITPMLRLDTAGPERARLFRSGSGFERYEDYGGTEVFASAARVPGATWVLLVKLPVREAMAEFRRAEQLILIAAALALVSLALGIRVLGRRAESAQRRTSEALAASERRLTDMMANVDLLALMIDRDGRIVFCNDALVRLTGAPREELMGRDAIDTLLPPERRAEARALLGTATAQGRVQTQNEAMLLTRGGTRRVHWNSTVLLDAAGAMQGIASIGEDVTARREMEDALRQSEELYRTMVEGARDLIFSVDTNGCLASLNPAFETMTGFPRDEWLGRRFEDILAESDHGEARAVFARMMQNNPQRPTAEFRLRTKDGAARLGEFTGTPQVKDGRVVGILGVCRDVTERVTMERQLRQSSRMEAVGQLAGGIAHDFNNLLTVIIGSTELMLTDMPDDNQWRADVQEIRASAGRAAMLTRQLLAFSRRQMLAPRRTDLNSLVTGAAVMLRRLIGEHISLVVKLHPGLTAVRADPGQLEQVIVNLAVNARDAMPSGGTVTITTAELLNDEPVAVGIAQLPPGAWCMLEVRDTGAGMSPDVLSHMFEPFFTTKPPGKGTGLGLASAYGVIKQSQGYIGVDSAPGAGTTFRIYLPPSADPATGEPAAAERRALPRGTESILVVEDEATVRAVAKQALLRQGYRVLEAGGGMEALSLTATGTGQIDLLLSDVVMPGMSGPELAERLLRRRPGLKVLFMSGYTEHAGESGGLLDGAPLLLKPFTPEDLARRVREVLDRRE